MQVAVELFGIPAPVQGRRRLRRWAAIWATCWPTWPERFPPLAETCIDGRSLRAGFIVNLCAERFVTSPETPLSEGDTVLLLSFDAGG